MAAPAKLMGAVGTRSRAWASARENVEKEKLEAKTRGTNRVVDSGKQKKRHGLAQTNLPF